MLTEQEAASLCSKLTFWPKLSAHDQRMLLTCAAIHTYRKGETMIDCLAPANGLMMILSGRMRVSIVSPEGREITLFLFGAGEFAVLPKSVLHSITFAFDLEAEEDCRVLLIPASIYNELMSRNLYVESYTYQLAANRFSEAIWVLQQMLFLSVDVRLASFLLQECAIRKSDTIVITQEQLARSLGTAREVVSRILKTFAARGIVRNGRGSIILLNKKELRLMTES